MQTFDTYEYRCQGRRPATYAALGLGMALTYVNHATDAPVLAWALVSVFVAVVLRILAVNRAAGLRLGHGQLEVFDGTARRSVALARICGADIDRGMCRLHLVGGAHLALPRAALPPARRLAQELRLCGIPVQFGTASAARLAPAHR
ncbi:MAG: hypothetical protein CVT82_08715 [Alphaproteobacteria bacterium HGW-Alphaproteobacteria-4]|nr:MAG: hypothetical protein CVT82_08715 [Alphaproteobacteria bacterium HGW-Alphaproteobacteria-4]